MADWKNIGKKALFPPVWLTLVLTVFSAVALTVIFVKGWDTLPAACAVYVVSFYTLSVITAACVKGFPALRQAVKYRIYANQFGSKYMSDAAYRTHFSLYFSLSVNLLYVAVNLFTGLWYRSVWSITLAAYYTILAVMRFLLVRFVNRVGIGKDREKELRRSRLCGMILMTVNLALSGVVILVIVQDKGFQYHGILIYVMAMYTFYVTIKSAIHIFQYRRYNSPVMSTAKRISLAAALVSMLSLETAMLSQFGDETVSSNFNQIMIGATGAGVSAVVLTMSVITVVQANCGLKALRTKGQTLPEPQAERREPEHERSESQ